MIKLDEPRTTHGMKRGGLYVSSQPYQGLSMRTSNHRVRSLGYRIRQQNAALADAS